jgi:murein DD-endopeptidase MepM/ murein hydrolase activator NlpD
LAVVWAAAAGAQTLRPDEVLSSVAVRAIGEPRPVTGTDGRVHLAYELLVDNAARVFTTLDRVEAVDEAGRVLAVLEGEGLAAMTERYSPGDGPLPPGGSAAIFMDVSFGPEEALPGTVLARLTVTRQAVGPEGKPAPLPAEFPVPATVSFTGAPAEVGPPAVVVAPPLEGAGWVAANGCCASITSHRGAIMAVNGVPQASERFAIDWVRMGPDGKLFSGDGSELADYAYYGVPVRAVADGVVVNLYDEAEAQAPGQIASITAENIGGNMIVTDIGGGNFAFYAHLQRGSLKVGMGDRVRTGQELALLGNSGNTTAPHLHFHVMDGPSPLDASGLPYAFTAFTLQGVLPDDLEAALEKGAAMTLDTTGAGPRSGALPLNNAVVTFE